MVHYYSCLCVCVFGIILHSKLIQVGNKIGGVEEGAWAQMPHSHIDVGQTGQICQYGQNKPTDSGLVVLFEGAT